MSLTVLEQQALDAVIDMACARFVPGQGPVFTAAVVQGDTVLTLDANEVSESCDPSRHAEVAAIARAAERLGRTDLSGCPLIASMQPCEMCLAAMRWSGIDRLVFAMPQEDAPAFFQFPGLTLDDFARAAKTPFHWHGGIGKDRVAHIYKDAP